MTAIEITNGRPASGGYKVDVSRGGHNGRVSSEWFSRPDDEKYLSLSELYASVKGRAERSKTRTVESAAIRVEAHRDDPERLALVLPDAEAPVAPTHWSFGQLASLVGAPAAYLRQLPAPLAGINLQYGLTNHRAEQVKTMETDDGRTELRAVTGPDYGRIYDHELVSAVQRIAGDGVGDTRWKVPGVLDWSTGVYNPMVDVTKGTTTLYASDRDVFLFLVDDMNPIEAGTLPDGSPDLFFRGFYCWNSEVGAKTLGIAMLLSPRGLPEPQSLGRRGFPGDQHPAFQIRCQPLRARSSAGIGQLRRLLTATFHPGHPLRARADRRAQRRRPHRLPEEARLLESGDRQDRRDRPRRGRPSARERVRLRSRHHRRRAVQAAAGRAACHGDPREDAPGARRVGLPLPPQPSAHGPSLLRGKGGPWVS